MNAGKADVEVRGCLVEECEVPIEAAAEDKGSEHDSDSDLDPDRCASQLLLLTVSAW